MAYTRCSGRHRWNHARYETLKAHLDERSRRLLAAAESQAVGKGGISIVAKATGISRPVIRQGIADLTDPTALAAGRVRKEGGGRKRVIDKDASLKTDLQSLLESTTRGDPQAALRWTCKSVRQLSAELKRGACPALIMVAMQVVRMVQFVLHAGDLHIREQVRHETATR